MSRTGSIPGTFGVNNGRHITKPLKNEIVLIFQSVVMIYMLMHSSTACPLECACSETQVECYRGHLKTIPEGIPVNVLSLDLRDNRITDLDAGKLTQLQQLKTLSLQLNHLGRLKTLTFVNITALTRLYLASNEIESIDSDAFKNLPALKDLDLTNNKLSEFPGKLKISSLQRLLLSNNAITSLQDNSLNGVRNLQYLILSNNIISHISKSSLNEMHNLMYLDLSGNRLTNIDNIFYGVPLLSYLDISSCRLTNIPRGLPWPLRTLKVSNNNLTVIRALDLQSVKYLGHLIADNNQIETIKDQALGYTPYLKEIRVSHNKIRLLPEIPKNIEIFIADDNKVDKLFEIRFDHDSTLKTLSLYNNNISEILPNTFSRLSNLGTLTLGHNKIKHLQNMSFTGMRKLVTLDLDFNPIEKIDYRAFSGLQKLEMLHLSNVSSNQTIIEGTIFQDVPSLTSLFIQGSPSIVHDIFNSSDLLRSLHKLQNLHVMNGNLETLSAEMKYFFPYLKSIHASNNPWHCDSNLVELHNWIKESPELFVNSNITCAMPDNLKGRSLQEVSLEELTMVITAEPAYSLSQSSEFVLNISASTADERMTQTGKLEEVTHLSHLSTVTSPAQMMTSERFIINSSLEAHDMTTSVQVVATTADYEKDLGNKHLSHQVITATVPVTEREPFNTTPSLITPDTRTNLQAAPDTTEYKSDLYKENSEPDTFLLSSRIYPQDTSTMKHSVTTTSATATWAELSSSTTSPPLVLPLKSTTATPKLSISTPDTTTAELYPRPDNQIHATSIPDDVSSTPGDNTSGNPPRKRPQPSHTLNEPSPSIPWQLTSSHIPASPVSPPAVSDTIQLPTTTTDTSPASTVQLSSIKTPATAQIRQGHQNSATEIPSSGSPVSKLSPSMITLPMTQPVIAPSSDHNLPTSQALDTITHLQATTEETLLIDASLTGSSTLMPSQWFFSQTDTFNSAQTSEPAKPESNNVSPSATQNTADHSTAETPEKEQNSTDSDRQGIPVKPVVGKPDNRLPTFSNSIGTKQRAVIMAVSTSLLALVLGLFISIIVLRYCKKRKHLSFDDAAANVTDIQTETSDTVFMIRHMECQYADNMNTDTSKGCKTSASSPDNTLSAENSDKQRQTGSKFSRQGHSAVRSKARFGCIKGQSEDDSELLVYSWN